MFQLRNHQNTVIDILSKNRKGQIIVPTGGGKTMCMIEDVKRHFKSPVSKTIVVVAPRILLANQLCSEFLEQNLDGNYNVGVAVAHVHSGETHHFSTTNTINITHWDSTNPHNHKLIFTTYHSLHKIQNSMVEVDTIYFDESHNAVQKNFIEAVEYYSIYASRCYFFTATPKHSLTPFKVGMNDADIFGQVICNVPAPKLVKQGYILPPKVVINKIDLPDDDRFAYEHDRDCVLDTIDAQDVDKILICARSTKQIINLVTHSTFVVDLISRGYSWLMITSKTGAVIDGKKVDREEFFNTLNSWGKDSSKRFVVLHHSILSEGINVKGLEAAMFLRSMDYITISQTIGRVIRKGDESKTFGLLCVPVYDKVGISTSRKVQAVVDTVFNKGEPAISVVRS
jgi:superfamily II DNA or RNA helicase